MPFHHDYCGKILGDHLFIPATSNLVPPYLNVKFLVSLTVVEVDKPKVGSQVVARLSDKGFLSL